MTLQFQHDGQLTHNSRADLVSAILQYVASPMKPREFDALFSHLLQSFGASEEQIGGDIYSAVSVLVYAGLIDTEGYNPDGKSIIFASGMTINPSRMLMGYVIGDTEKAAA
jgi:hypothetical protein